MPNKSQRIRTTVNGNDKYLTLKLENDVDFFEILSLKISQKDVYGSFNSDYGVIVGRVIANGGVGIPNAKLSVFIPISDEDKLRSDILTIYPYTSPRDKDLNGVRYNLLPRVGVNNPFLISGEYAPKVPIGTFPTKEEITTNETFLEVYEKYYKYTTVTNQSGDYMIFGVPIGIQTVHMSVDITDIGKYSMNSGTMITNLGYSPSLFNENGTKIRFSTDLETLPNVETQEVAVEVRPFWGDVENFEIGITRQDFKIRAVLLGSTTVFGSCFTDGETVSRGTQFGSGEQAEDMWRITDAPGDYGTHIQSRRIGKITANVLALKNTVSDTDAGVIVGDANLHIYGNGTFDTEKDYVLLSENQYTSYIENGVFALILPCDRRKIITNEIGDEVVVDNDNPNGIFTEFRGFIVFNMDNDQNLPINADFKAKRVKMKIPQTAIEDQTFTNPSFPNAALYNEQWRKQHYKFSSGKYYSISKFNPLTYRDNNGVINDINQDIFWNVGIINLEAKPASNLSNVDTQFPSNGISATYSIPVFGAEWINFCLMFDQYGNGRGRGGAAEINTNLTNDYNSFFFVDDNANNELIGGTLRNNKYYLRSDRHKTTFIDVPKEDLLLILEKTIDGSSKKGFKSTDAPYDSNPLIGTDYKATGGIKYFYKGLVGADCIILLNELSLI